MKPLKVFISQPMRDIPKEIIQFRRNKAIKELQEYFSDFNVEIEIINSYSTDIDLNHNSLHLLGNAIYLLADADIIYMTKDWEKARGCKIEFECAKEYGIDIMFQKS